MQFLTKSAAEVSDRVNTFYKNAGRPTKKLEPNDQVVMAILDDEIVGVVRLCFEQDHYVLRTMQVHPEFQRQGVGQQILNHFEVVLNEQKIMKSYCFAFAHLEDFYGRIGYKKIENSEAPLFLQQRLTEAMSSYPDEKFINMVRIV
jgi:N-acetylglutamate synthase-like GNAT family acetyltransferase